MSLQQLKKLIRYSTSKYDLAFEIGELVIDARVKTGLTQAKLAKKVGTKQSAIARLESSIRLPSLTFLKKVANAMGMDVIVKLKEKKTRPNSSKERV